MHEFLIAYPCLFGPFNFWFLTVLVSDWQSFYNDIKKEPKVSFPKSRIGKVNINLLKALL